MRPKALKLVAVLVIALTQPVCAQNKNAYTCGSPADPGGSYPVSCAPGCVVYSGVTTVDSQNPQGGITNLNSSGVTLSLECVAPPGSSASCAPVSYFYIAEDDQQCGVCPDCGNQYCPPSYQYPGCCDNNSECQPGGICNSCAPSSCTSPGAAGYACCSNPDCASGLSCAAGACADCSNTCNNTGCPGYNAYTCECQIDSCYDSGCPGYDYCTCNSSDPSCGGGSGNRGHDTYSQYSH